MPEEKKLLISIKLREGHDVILDINNKSVEEAIESIDTKLRFNHNIDLKKEIDNARRTPRV